MGLLGFKQFAMRGNVVDWRSASPGRAFGKIVSSFVAAP
jgi:large-conductance mechanosensitive channel